MLRVLELFAGIGACSKALEKLGIEHEIVDAVENDKYAIKSFNAIHNTNFEVQDIKEWNKKLEDIDLVMHGSPCTDFSLAGLQKGGDEGSGTRSSLMYESIRIIKNIKPKYVVWENVKNLLSKKHIHNFNAYLDVMEQLGYKNYHKVLNAKEHGIPQNRERVFTISIRNDINKNFEFPKKEELKIKLKDLLEQEVDDKYYLSEKMIKCFLSENTGKYPRKEVFLRSLNKKNRETANTIITTEGSKPNSNFIKIKNATKQGYLEGTDGDSVNLSYPRCETRRGRVGNQVSQTLQCNDTMGVIDEDLKIRKLTPRECFRLMGFDDEDFDKVKDINSNTQLYKQAGNSIVVDVLKRIFEKLF